ncbi:type I restriction-modification system subunit M [Luminiphilus sp.]|nr:type I restriction-modification system subunit M [Luminiphilus sp.]
MADDFKQTLWKTADKLRAQMDPGEYKHVVLGLIFVKYISDTFVKQQDKVKSMVSELSSDYFISEDPAEYAEELEERDYYIQDNVFWVPQEARWEALRSKAKQPDIGSLIDDAMTAIENENTPLRGKLDKRFGRSELGQGILGELIDLVSTIGFADKYDASDLLGEVYEYFLGQFASAEGKKGGQFYTPSHVVKTLVAVLSPNSGRVYDPCCGSGGMFVQSEEFVKAHGGRVDDISIYGQESNPTTWRLAAMNLAIRGFAADLGKEPADTFARDQFPDVKFDYIMANPPFNISDWGGEKYESDPRWRFGRPPVGNANYAWLQHMLWKLRPGGQAGVVLANGSMSSNTGGEGQIREAMVRSDVVEVMVALPGQLFLNTQIPVCLWFLTNDKTMNGRDRRGETLFIDARQLGTMETRVLKVFTDEDIAKIQETVQSWKTGEGYEDVAGFCKSASLEEIEKNGFVLTPGRYVGAEEEEISAVSFQETLEKLNLNLLNLQEKSAKLDARIVASLGLLKND